MSHPPDSITAAPRCVNSRGHGQNLVRRSDVDKSTVTCSVDTCDRGSLARGWCSLHYQRWRAHGDPRGTSPPQLKGRCDHPECTGRHGHQGPWKEMCPAAAQRHLRANKEWQKANPDKRSKYQRSWDLKNKFGITLDDYESMLQAQGGVCAICCTVTPSKRGWFCVDHDHKSGRVRGLLCSRCNTAIGSMGDDPERLRSAAEYIEAGICDS